MRSRIHNLLISTNHLAKACGASELSTLYEELKKVKNYKCNIYRDPTL